MPSLPAASRLASACLRTLDETWSQMQRYQVYRAAAAERAVQSQAEHQAIFAAMQNGDGEQAEAAVKAHYLHGDRQFSAYLHALAQAAEKSDGADPA